MKVVVYAIAKNEEKNVLNWYESMSEADEIYVLDTGSTDRTIELLKKCEKVHVVSEIINPWRFDVARNKALSLVPDDADICVCTDLDDIFIKGWRKIVENNWVNVNQLQYTYICNLKKDGSFTSLLRINKIHSRHNFEWIYPIHEVLRCNVKPVSKFVPELILTTTLLATKHGNYIDLLKLAVKENPTNPRHKYLLGREYYLNKMYDQAIEIYHDYLKIGTWNQERSYVMRSMARCYKTKGYLEEAIMWYEKAIKETPNEREPNFELGELYFYDHDYKNAIKYLQLAQKIKEKNTECISDYAPWSGVILDMLAQSYFYEGKYQDAYKYGLEASKKFPNDERILKNLNLYRDYKDR